MPTPLPIRVTQRELRRIEALLRTETVGGVVLVAAAVVALIWANSPWTGAYHALLDHHLAVGSLSLPVHAWASDGLLAVFFFLVGLELKHEIVSGDLRNPATAVVPVAAAAGGVVVPVLIYVAINAGGTGAAGWAIPSATDIAFALAVLALVSSHLPAPLRVFLLTLAVVDDLIAIIIIAVAYTSSLQPWWLLAAILPLAAFALVVRRWGRQLAARRWLRILVLVPLAVAAWACVHESGIHATLTGVALGLLLPAGEDEGSLAATLDHELRPLSSGIVVPVFALASAGVTIGGAAAFAAAVTDPVTIGVVVGLVIGKPLGIVATTFLLTRLTKADLEPGVAWADLWGIGALGGLGFTVSLLVTELSFPASVAAHDHGKLGVLLGSVLAALVAAAILVPRNRQYRDAQMAIEPSALP